MTHEQESELNILVREHDRLSGDIRTTMAASERLVALGFAVLAAGVSLGIEKRLEEVLVVLPFVAFVVLFYVVGLFTFVFALGGYKRYVEERINQLVGTRVLLWEPIASRWIHHNLPTLVLYFMYGGFFVVILNFANDVMSDAEPRDVYYGYWGVVLVLFVMLLISFAKMAWVFNGVWRQAQKMGKEKP